MVPAEMYIERFHGVNVRSICEVYKDSKDMAPGNSKHQPTSDRLSLNSKPYLLSAVDPPS